LVEVVAAARPRTGKRLCFVTSRTLAAAAAAAAAAAELASAMQWAAAPASLARAL